MRFHELYRDYETAGTDQIGELTYQTLGTIVRAHVVFYPERVYADAPRWDDAELSNVLHEWIERLHKPAIGTGDIPYAQMLTRAGGQLRVLRAMLVRSLSQLMDDRPLALERRVGRVEAHNLYKRIKRILMDEKDIFIAPAGARRGPGPEHYWTLAEAPAAEVSRSNGNQLARLAEVRTDEEWEVRWNKRPGKASRILTDEKLREFLVLVLRGAGGAVNLATLSEAFNIRFGLFTKLVDLENATDMWSDEDAAWYDAAADHVIEHLSPSALAELRAPAVPGEPPASDATATRGERELLALVQELAGGPEDRVQIYRAALRRLADDHNDEGN